MLFMLNVPIYLFIDPIYVNVFNQYITKSYNATLFKNGVPKKVSVLLI